MTYNVFGGMLNLTQLNSALRTASLVFPSVILDPRVNCITVHLLLSAATQSLKSEGSLIQAVML